MNSETLKLAMELIAKPSITPKDEGCQEILAERLKKIGFKVQSYQFEDVTNLWATKGTPSPQLCFAGHTDVVPPGDLSLWNSPPFSPTLQNGFLVGRGAADMKSSIAAMVTACERFFTKYPNHKGDMGFLITSNEEGTTNQHGTQAVLKVLAKQNAIPKWCLVGEASSSHQLADTIKIGRRGSLTGILKIKGIQGHVAYPNLALNPIHKALLPLHEIAHFDWDDQNPYFPPSSLQFSNIQSGTGANNVIPGSLSATLNIRFTPRLTVESIQETVQAILKQHQVDYEIEWLLGGKPFLTSEQSSFVQAVITVIENTVGSKPELSTSGGTSDGRFFAEYGSEVLELGPLNHTIHQVNECIQIEELDRLSSLYENIITYLLG